MNFITKNLNGKFDTIETDSKKRQRAEQERTYIYYKSRSLNKRERTHTGMFYGDVPTKNLEFLAERISRAERDFWISASEYGISLRTHVFLRVAKNKKGTTQEETCLRITVINRIYLFVSLKKTHDGKNSCLEKLKLQRRNH